MEYVAPDNTTRPGGPLYKVSFASKDSPIDSIFQLLADNETLTPVIIDAGISCGGLLSPSYLSAASPYQIAGLPAPEQAVQYYRASSVVLTLDGYNNTAVFSENEDTPDLSLPNNTDMSLMNCLNGVIIDNVLLVVPNASPRTTSSATPSAASNGVVANLSLLFLVFAIFRSLIVA